MYTFDIYFSDLNDDAKARLLEFAGVESASDMNWDMDILPIACFDLEKDDESAKKIAYNLIEERSKNSKNA